MTVILPKARDNAKGQLNAGISAAVLSIPLKAGEGTLFPQPYTGTASSAGSRTVLNDTGDLASLAVGDFIRNVTDGSWAFVVTAGTNSITTTRLQGGTDNTWDSADTWRAAEFIITLAKINASGVDTQYEEVLISNRSTDTLTVPTGGRGYNSTTAQAFDADDYVQLRVTAPHHEELKKLLKELNVQVDTDTTNLTTAQTDIDNIESGSSFYIAAGGSANAFTATYSPVPAYAAGLRLTFKANHSITGTTTINVNALGAKTIKKNDGATNLVTGDIINGQIVEIEYDGTNFQMTSPVGTPATIQYYDKTVYLSGASSTALTNPTSLTTFDTHTHTIPANDLIAGVEYEYDISITVVYGVNSTAAVAVKLGATNQTQLDFITSGGAGTGQMNIRGRIIGTAAAGAAVAVRMPLSGQVFDNNAAISGSDYSAANCATNGTLAIAFSFLFGTSNAGNSATMTSCKITKRSTSAFA